MAKLYIGSELMLPETSDIVLKEDLSEKQDTLVSGTNIKTINNQSILGSGNITIEGGVSGDGIGNIVSISKSEYDSLAYKDNETIYVVETPVLSAGTIVYYSGGKINFCASDAWTSSSGTPVAVVVVPNTHTPDGTVRCMAINGVNADGSQASSNVAMVWGPTGTDTGLPNLTSVPTWDNTVGGTIGSAGWARLSSNNNNGYFTGSTDCLDANLKYYNTEGPFVPNPYLPDGTANPDYRSSTITNNACADFDGKGNTSVLIGLGAAYSAANACYLYSASGISNWYLPACGELGYIMPRFMELQSTLSTVGGVQLVADDYFWSSSESSSANSRYVRTDNGSVSYKDKSNTYYVRPFCSLSAPTPGINLYKGSELINYSKSEIDAKIGDIQSILQTI